MRPILAGEQDGQGDTHENAAVDNDEGAEIVHPVNAALAASENRQEDFRLCQQGNHQFNDVVENQNLPPQGAGDFGFELYPVSP